MAREPFIVRDEAGRQRVLDLIAQLDLSKQGWKITVAPNARKRSLDQNALYHKWCGIIAAETGHSHDEIHEWCKGQFLEPRIVEFRGEVMEIRTTTNLTTAQMSDFMNRVYAWATSELGLLLPIPEELGRAA